MAFSTSGPTVNPGAAGYYQTALAQSGQNYQNILSGFSNAQSNLSQNLGNIYAEYGGVRNSVMNDLGIATGGQPNGSWGVAQPAAQAIADEFTKQQGQIRQGLISSGLGNSTIQGNLLNQSSLEAAKAYGGLGAQLAQTAAGYEGQIGMAGLGAQMQGAGMQTGLAQGYMSNLAGFHFPTPPPMYGQQSYSYQPQGGSGGYGGASSTSGGSPFSGWLSNTGVPMYSGGAGNAMGYAGAYGGYGSPQAAPFNPYTSNGPTTLNPYDPTGQDAAMAAGE